MKSYPTKGWAIVHRGARSESPSYRVHLTKNEAIHAFASFWSDRNVGHRVFNERICDGSIRVTRVKIVIDEDTSPKKPAKKEVKK